MNVADIYEAMRPMPPFRPELRKANREGLKSQTRRVADQDFRMQKVVRVSTDSRGEVFDFILEDETGMLRKCPYGKAGDYAYMREPLARKGAWAYYKDDDQPVISAITQGMAQWRWKKDALSGMFMPKEAARSIYRYKKIRVERVREMMKFGNHLDVFKEGLRPIWHGDTMGKTGVYETWLVEQYRLLWDEINAKRGYGWEVNPWVWVLEYEPVEVGHG